MDLTGFAGLGAVLGVSDRGRRSTEAAGVTVDIPFRIASLTKTLTAAATARALRNKGFGLDQAVVELLPQLTVEQVLAQSTGLRQSVTAAAVEALGEGDEVFLEAAKLVVAAGHDYPPGERWAYYNGNYLLAGALLASLTGSTFEAALGEFLAAVDLKATSFSTPEPVREAAYPRARRPSGGLWSTVPDLLTFCEFLLQDKGLLAEMGRLPDVIFVRGGVVVPNPWAR
jgi:D-alanyl-D-alanine carboxypeptidase